MKDKMMDDDIENVGIMKGFMDSMDDEGDEGDDEGSEDEETLMERRPDSPEILMNNLRGDMRSVDARRDELADLVGYKAAKETPDQVLAMLQPILAQQGGGGIGALPQSQPMAQGPQPPMMGAAPGAAPGGAPGAPPPGMPPMPPMPEGGGAPPPPADGGIAALMAGMGGGAPGGGMPPSDQPPVAMARGGYVQHFQTGSDESGVTPAGSQTATDDPLLSYSPELVQAAKDSASALITQRPQAIPTLESRLQARLPEYQKLMGADKGAAQAQMLLELGQRAFGFAANTDEGGRPLRGSFISRLAGATKTLPSVMGRHIESMDKIDRQVKALALQQGEKDIDQIVSQNTELLKRKTDLFKEVLKANARLEAEKMKGLSSSIFGKGDWEWNLVNMPGMMDRYAKGETTDNETNLISSAITKLKTPRIETRLHPVTKVPFTVEIPGMPPQFVIDAENARKGLNLSVTPTPAMSGPGGGTVRLSPDGSIITPGAQRQPGTAAGGAPAAGAPMDGPGAAAQGAAPARPPAGGSGMTLWNTRFDVAGPVGAAVAMGTSIPGLGDPAAANTLARKNAELLAERLKEAMLKSVAGSVWEQKNLDKVLAIRPSAMTDPDVYGTRLIALGQALREGIASYNAMGADNSNLAPEDKARAREKAMEYQKFLGQLGLPPAVYSAADISRYPPGTEVLLNGVTLKRIKAPEGTR
jgi:hypothetical protein